MKNWINNRKNISDLSFEEGKSVVVAGFLKEYRKCGKILFLKIRDFTGEIQIFIKDPEIIGDSDLKKESVVYVSGILKTKQNPTPEDAFNSWEVVLNDYYIASKSNLNLPFSIDHPTHVVDEEIRLKYRYLDLRNKRLRNNLIFYSKVKNLLANFFVQKGFVEIGTPALSLSSREGAKTFNTVFEQNKCKKEFSLSQSPQLYKQLLMISGIEKYFQFSTSFRLEDLRSDRQYEFTQLDIEMSFSNKDILFGLIEESMKLIFKECLSYEIKESFPRISYQDAYEKYGTDKPDLRYDFEIENFSSHFENKEVFGLYVSNEDVDISPEMTKDCFVARKSDQAIEGTFLSEHSAFVESMLGNKEGIFFFVVISDKLHKNHQLSILGKIRQECAEKLKIIDDNLFCFAWIVDWPLFEFNVHQNTWVPAHHLFTRPNHNKQEIDVESDKSCGYDLVLNGIELSSGSERIFSKELQQKMFKKVHMTDKEIESDFGWFLNAMDYGVPPHLGLAIGLERLIQVMLKENSIRDVIAFPKNNHGSCPMTNSPRTVETK